MNNLIFRVLFMMEADGGGGGPIDDAAAAAGSAAGGSDTAAADAADATADGGAREEVEEEWRGWWGSQLPKAARDRFKDRLTQLKGRSMADILDDYFAAGDKLKGAVVFPGKDAKPDEIDAFLAKMSIPKTADGYKLDPAGLPESWTDEGRKEFAASIAEVCKRNGLTLRQGNALYKTYAAHVADIQAKSAKLREIQKDTFDRRLEEECGDEKKSAETKEYFKRALVALGDKRFVKELEESGLFYSPVVARAIGDLWKAGNAEPPLASAGGGTDDKKSDGGLPKSAAFTERYGNRSAK
jgi:hypothetical protein